MDPAFEVELWDFYEDLKPVKLIMVTAWAHALKAEVSGIVLSQPPCSEIVRDFLSTPDDYPVEDLADYIDTSLKDFQKQLGLS